MFVLHMAPKREMNVGVLERCGPCLFDRMAERFQQRGD